MNLCDQLTILGFWCVPVSSPLRLWDSPQSWSGGPTFFNSVSESVETIQPSVSCFPQLSFSLLFSLPLSHAFPLGIKEKVSRRKNFNIPRFWPYSWSALLPPERMLLYHICHCFTAIRLLTQIQKHPATFQWSVPSGSAEGWWGNQRCCNFLLPTLHLSRIEILVLPLPVTDCPCVKGVQYIAFIL